MIISTSFNQSFTCIGVMSGTSMDGIDAVVAQVTPGKTPWHISNLHHYSQSMPEGYAQRVQAILANNDMKASIELGYEVSELYAQAIEALLAQAGLKNTDIDMLGVHGQTVFHRPPLHDQHGLSIQALDLSSLAQRLQIDTVGRFRSRDMTLGGQGAPMACYGHEKLWGHPEQTTLVLNLGGIANTTLLEKEKCTLGFDTGPANLWMDTLVYWHTNGKESMDRNGQYASKGNIDQNMVKNLLKHPYFDQKPPKSTGFETFGAIDLMPNQSTWMAMSIEDALATANFATASSIAQAIGQSAQTQQADRLIVCGGGAHNTVLVGHLNTLLPDIHVQTSDQTGYAPETIEGICFGLLAHACVHRQPGNIAAVTGASAACISGEIALAQR